MTFLDVDYVNKWSKNRFFFTPVAISFVFLPETPRPNFSKLLYLWDIMETYMYVYLLFSI